MVFDPFTGNLDGTGRSVFSSGGRINVIPQSRLNAPMMKYAGAGSRPNRPGTPTITSIGQSAPEPQQHRRQGQLEPERAASAVVQVQRDGCAGEGRVRPRRRPGAIACAAAASAPATRWCRSRGMGQTYTVSPTFLIDGTFGWTRFGQNVTPPDLGTNFGSDVLGIPGTNGPDPRESGMPPMYILRLLRPRQHRGLEPALPQRPVLHLQHQRELEQGHARHPVRLRLRPPPDEPLAAGARRRPARGVPLRSRRDGAESGRARRHGRIPGRTRRRSRTTGMPWRGSCSARPTASGKSSQFIKMNSMENVYALYVRDRWRLRPNLTVDLGLRWELYPNRWRSGGLGIESYDPEHQRGADWRTGAASRRTTASASARSSLLHASALPTRCRDSTVIRSGYGITYHSHPWGAQALRGWYPLTVVAVFYGMNGYQPVTTSPRMSPAGVPNAPLGPTVGIPSICCPDISTGRIPLPLVGRDWLSGGEPGTASRLHPVVEPDRRAQTAGRFRCVGWIRRVGVGQRLRVPGHQRLADPGSGDEGRPLFPKFGRTTTTREWDGRTHSIYHSLQTTLNRRSREAC